MISVFLLLVAFGLLVYWSKSEASTQIEETIVVGEEKEWTHYDEFNRIYEETALTEKQKIVQMVQSEIIEWPKYTVRVWYEGRRKPIPPLNALTFDERAKQWLDTVGLWHTLNTWKALGGKYSIDYTLPLCVAWSDSHLWKALASKNNVGNVWNNDRGDRVHYETLDKWIEAIFRALNNKWMWGSTMLGQLSGEWRARMGIEGCNDTKSNQKCYATSKTVWSTNVSNCLSAIHNKQVSEDYEFRK